FEGCKVLISLGANLLGQVCGRFTLARESQTPARHFYVVTAEEFTNILLRLGPVLLSTIPGNKCFIRSILQRHCLNHINWICCRCFRRGTAAKWQSHFSRTFAVTRPQSWLAE